MIEEENFERKMFVDTHKTRQTCNSFSPLPFQQDCLLIFALFYYSLLFLKLEIGGGGGGAATPVFPLFIPQ